MSAVYLNGVAQSRGWSVERGLSAGDHVRDGARLGRRDHGRFWRPLALPLRRRRPGLRGIHVDAVRVPDLAAHDGSAVTTPPSFPTLAGLGWSVHKKPVFSTIVASHVSGREVRDALLSESDLAIRADVRCHGFDGQHLSRRSAPTRCRPSWASFFSARGNMAPFFTTTRPIPPSINGTFATGDGSTTTFTFSATWARFSSRSAG